MAKQAAPKALEGGAGARPLEAAGAGDADPSVEPPQQQPHPSRGTEEEAPKPSPQHVCPGCPLFIHRSCRSCRSEMSAGRCRHSPVIGGTYYSVTLGAGVGAGAGAGQGGASQNQGLVHTWRQSALSLALPHLQGPKPYWSCLSVLKIDSHTLPPRQTTHGHAWFRHGVQQLPKLRGCLNETWVGKPIINKLTHTLHLLSSHWGHRTHQPLVHLHCLSGVWHLCSEHRGLGEGRVGQDHF